MTDTRDTVAPRATTGRITVNAGDTVMASWGNTTFDQTVECFDSPAARDSQWPAPHDGAMCYTADAALLWLRQSGVWVQIWPRQASLPLGRVADLTGPASAVNCGSTTTTVMTMNMSAVAGRRYKVSAFSNSVQQTATGTGYLAYSSSGGYFTGVRLFTAISLPIGNFASGSAFAVFAATATATVTITLVGNSNAGALQVGANYATLVAEDIGT